MSKKFLQRLIVAIPLCWLTLDRRSAAQSAPPAPLTGLLPHHVTISVENLDREVDWYVRVLGFKAEPRNGNDPDFRNQHVIIPGYRIDLIQFKGSSRPVPANPLYLRQGWIHIAFSVSDLSAALKELQALNTDVRADNKDAKGVPTRLVVHDPESNEIELFSRE